MSNRDYRQRIVRLLLLGLLIAANAAVGQPETEFFLPAYAAEFFAPGPPDVPAYAILVGAFAVRDRCDAEQRGLCSLQLPSFIRRDDSWRLPHELLILAPPEWHLAKALLRKLQRCGLAAGGLLVKTSRAELLVGLDPATVCLSDHDPLPELCPESGEDSQPQLLRFSQPAYPDSVRRELIEGVVIIRVLVGARGQVESAEVSQSLHPELDAAALAAARQCQFLPARQAGLPVRAWMAIPFSFRLDGNHTLSD